MAATTTAVPDVTMTSTLRWTNSAAISAARSVRPSAQRYSIAIVRPSIHPSSRSRCTKAATHWPWVAGVAEPKYPMVGSLPGCCARAASGHAAVRPPSAPRNSRRLISAHPKRETDRPRLPFQQGWRVRHNAVRLTDVRVGSNPVFEVMSAARPLFHRKRKSMHDLAMSHKCQQRAFRMTHARARTCANSRTTLYGVGSDFRWFIGKGRHDLVRETTEALPRAAAAQNHVF